MPKNSQSLLTYELSEYLKSSRLSLSQVANKLEISKGHLSEIKNGKKSPGLDLGLKILKFIGSEEETRKTWAERFTTELSSEYESLTHTVEETTQKKRLTEQACQALYQNLDLMNLYLDIVNEDDHGMARSVVYEQYGKNGIQQLERLVNHGLLKLEKQRYYAGDQRLVMTKNASYDFMQKILEQQKSHYLNKTLQGKFQFVLDDLSDTGFEELETLFEDTMKKASEIYKEHRQHTTRGGHRFVFQSLLGKVKLVLAIALFGLMATSGTKSWAGGIEGGSSWNDILRSYDHIVSFPSIPAAGSFFTVDSFCHENGVLKSDRTSKRCVKWRETVNDRYCVEKREFPIESPRQYTEKRCLKFRRGDSGKCEQWEKVHRLRPLKYKVDVDRLVERDNEREFAFSKEYVIPDCN